MPRTPCKAQNRDMKEIKMALEVVGAHRYDDPVFKIMIGDNIRAINRHAELLGPTELEIAMEHSLVADGKVVYVNDVEGNVTPFPRIDPDKYADYQKKQQLLLDDEFDLPCAIYQKQLELGKEVSPEGKVSKWEIPMNVYMWLRPILILDEAE